MNRIKKILLVILLIPTMAFSDASDDWLWEEEAKTLKIDSTQTVTVCEPGYGCKVLIIYSN